MNDRNTQDKFYPRMSTPWGSINTYHRLADGIYTVDTPGHGGLWLSDERMAELPEHYEPYTGTRRWAEEDEDAPLVLQYLGLLSLIPETLTLEIREVDIIEGRKSRKGLYREKWNWADDEDGAFYGGAIVEAYQRQTGDVYDEMVCSHYLSPYPGGFKLAHIGDAGREWQASFDKGHAVKPITLTLEPYRIPEPVPYVHHLKDGGTRIDRCNGYHHKYISEGSIGTLFMYQELYIKADVVKVTHEDRVIWERKDAVAVSLYAFDVFNNPNRLKCDIIFGGFEAAKKYVAERYEQVGLKAQEAWGQTDKTYFKREYIHVGGARRMVALELQ